MSEENLQTTDNSSQFLLEMLTDEHNGDAFAHSYLKASFLSSAIDALFQARRQAGLTQAQVAEKLGTKQAAIARLEADTEGAISLRRYVEFALACGMVPLNIELVPINAARDSILTHLIEKPYEP